MVDKQRIIRYTTSVKCKSAVQNHAYLAYERIFLTNFWQKSPLQKKIEKIEKFFVGKSKKRYYMYEGEKTSRAVRF